MINLGFSMLGADGMGTPLCKSQSSQELGRQPAWLEERGQWAEPPANLNR